MSLMTRHPVIVVLVGGVVGGVMLSVLMMSKPLFICNHKGHMAARATSKGVRESSYLSPLARARLLCSAGPCPSGGVAGLSR